MLAAFRISLTAYLGSNITQASFDYQKSTILTLGDGYHYTWIATCTQPDVGICKLGSLALHHFAALVIVRVP